jgi:hypothetical protein
MEASAGGLWFMRRIPDPVATRFNFTASAGPTLELRVTPAQSLRVGYLWHHTSNGGTGKVNPGLNSGILALGLLWHTRPERHEQSTGRRRECRGPNDVNGIAVAAQ